MKLKVIEVKFKVTVKKIEAAEILKDKMPLDLDKSYGITLKGLFLLLFPCISQCLGGAEAAEEQGKYSHSLLVPYICTHSGTQVQYTHTNIWNVKM